MEVVIRLKKNKKGMHYWWFRLIQTKSSQPPRMLIHVTNRCMLGVAAMQNANMVHLWWTFHTERPFCYLRTGCTGTERLVVLDLCVGNNETGENISSELQQCHSLLQQCRVQKLWRELLSWLCLFIHLCACCIWDVLFCCGFYLQRQAASLMWLHEFN